MTARWILDTYRSGPEAIRASIEADSRLRSISNDQVRGKFVRRMSWDDAALTFELEGGQYLNIVARAQSVACSLDDVPMAVATPSPEDVVLLELNGHADEWRRCELSQKFIGKALVMLQFGDRVFYVYVKGAVLFCHLIVSCDGEKPWLYWFEGE
jgi:hypothetical protein